VAVLISCVYKRYTGTSRQSDAGLLPVGPMDEKFVIAP
jgi:hypothetical protein